MTAGSGEVRRLRHALAEALHLDGRRDQALEQLRSSLHEAGSTPSDAELWDSIGRVQEDLGDSAAALESYLEAAVSDPTHQPSVAASLRLLPAHSPAQRWRGTGDRLADSIRSRSAGAAAHLLAALLLRRDDEPADAAEQLRLALRKPGELATTLVDELVDTYLEQGDVAHARIAFDAAPPGIAPAAHARLLLAEGRFDDVLTTATGEGPVGAIAARIYALIGLDRAEDVAGEPDSLAPHMIAARVAALLATRSYDQAQDLVDRLAGEVDEPACQLLRAQVLLEGAGSVRPGVSPTSIRRAPSCGTCDSWRTAGSSRSPRGRYGTRGSAYSGSRGPKTTGLPMHTRSSWWRSTLVRTEVAPRSTGAVGPPRLCCRTRHSTSWPSVRFRRRHRRSDGPSCSPGPPAFSTSWMSRHGRCRWLATRSGWRQRSNGAATWRRSPGGPRTLMPRTLPRRRRT